MINDFKIEKCKILNKWLVFEKVGVNAFEEVYRAKTKKECVKWANEQMPKQQRMAVRTRKIEKAKRNQKKYKVIEVYKNFYLAKDENGFKECFDKSFYKPDKNGIIFKAIENNEVNF